MARRVSTRPGLRKRILKKDSASHKRRREYAKKMRNPAEQRKAQKKRKKYLRKNKVRIARYRRLYNQMKRMRRGSKK